MTRPTPFSTDAHQPERPLEGVRVVDFTRHMAGPYATVALSDFGADVVKVESAEGDPSRSAGTAFIGDQAAPFLIWNRGKRSIGLDLRSERGVAVARRLAASADVVIENYRPGVADEIGIGYDTLSALNPRLIYCAVSAFGPSGPLASLPGTDPIVQAMSGVMSVTGERDRDPVLTGIPIADFTGAMLAVPGILLALVARDRTGRGPKVDVSMLYGLLSALTTRLGSYWATGEDPPRYGSAHSTLVPFQAFRAADGQVLAGTWGGDSWPRFCRALGRPELADDPRFATSIDRAENREELADELQGIFATKTVAEWEKRFNDERALFAPILSFSQILSHPHVLESGLVQSVEHASLGTIPQLGPPIALSDTPPRISGPAPLFGQHTREVLAEIGLAPGEIDELVEDGVARAWAGDAAAPELDPTT
jgi:formyl-CoA transferase/CoA:oxalate CoA-transferase